MTALSTACSALPRPLRQAAPQGRCGARRDVIGCVADSLTYLWLRWRRRAVIRALDRVDDRLLRDAGIERADIVSFVDALMARSR